MTDCCNSITLKSAESGVFLCPDEAEIVNQHTIEYAGGSDAYAEYIDEWREIWNVKYSEINYDN